MAEFLVENRWAAAALWCLLHSLDYYLTLWSVRIHRAGAAERLDVGGSLELNPVMRGALERRRAVSWRFVVTLVGVAAILWFAWPELRDEPSAWEFFLGAILFSRIVVIGQHAHTIVFLRAVAAGRIEGKLVYPRRTVLGLSALRYGGEAVLLAVGALVSESAWLWGGAVTVGALALAIAARTAWLWLRKR